MRCEVRSNETKRQTKIPSKYNDYELYMAFDAAGFIDNVPKDFEDLQGRPERYMWEEAMTREANSIKTNNTWEPIAENETRGDILDTKWVFSYKPMEEKEEDRYKARLVVRGFAQSF